MIRIINCDGQITDNKCFAIYDTIIDKFVEINGEQIWDSVDDFEHVVVNSRGRIRNESHQTRSFLERCAALARNSGY